MIFYLQSGQLENTTANSLLSTGSSQHPSLIKTARNTLS